MQVKRRRQHRHCRQASFVQPILYNSSKCGQQRSHAMTEPQIQQFQTDRQTDRQTGTFINRNVNGTKKQSPKKKYYVEK